MRWQYPRYRNSGVEWLGEVPSHWEVRRIRQTCRFAYGNSLPSGQRKEGDVPVFGSNGIVGLHNKANTYAPVIVIGRKGSYGEVNFNHDAVFAIDTTYFVDKRFTRSDLRWLYYALMCADLRDVSMDSAVPGLSREHAHRKFITFPPLDEQRAISAFLDRETERIDKLVVKKRLLIERLTEYRTALITRTVTQGLPPEAARADGYDPSPRIKPSNVEWLGDVPAHWDVVALRHRYLQSLGKMLDSKRITGTYLLPYIRNVDVQWDQINVDDLPTMDITPDEYDRYMVRPGDLLVCEGGEVGRCAIWPGELAECGFQKALHRLRPRNTLQDVPRFLLYVLRAAAGADAFNDGLVSTISHLTGEKLRAHSLPFPPIAEQRAIAAFLDRETARIDSLSRRVETAMERLQEYRTALITAAVTGKIDVREPVYEEAV